MKRIIVGLVLVFFCHIGARGDNIRGPYGGDILLGGSGSFSREIRLKLEDIASVQLNAAPSNFLIAIEFEVKIPNAVRQYRDSFALFFYRNIKPKPDPEVSFYRGDQVSFEVIPPRNQIYYQLPVKPDVSLPASPDTVLLAGTVRADQLPLLITILPVMKGIPSFILSSEFRVRGRGIFEKTGHLELTLVHPEEPSPDSFSLFVDGKPFDVRETIIPLSIGMHTVTLVSEIYRPLSMNFGVETGKTTAVELILENQIPRVYLEKPLNADIFIDGEKVEIPSGAGMELQEGEHAVLFKIGDYSLSKKVYIERGKDYDISLLLDIIVSEK